ncbi:hypothetical protein SPRG_10462 [Saprolegnia parasitica CBS 223.65]|uniref:Multifunctional methyltransferase subunit TRM112 n=1 Tax=Saprolegnia parasitica (strain CBS 223.65) TaxID=695850 RepID=A0A067C0R8_SAPPC|nr:hypothetical protein SPRG_10462 [Saprolegnia parasitica CBS 223.65]KDO24384.1 hypothetical protein SPRG_10462 [Saprolegnia parasitica CBS 223.65]|eukprot:XP_012204977.1 hypothetical protein SPRG_10462 [Saprolegnia parasitica CBS 223.65]
MRLLTHNMLTCNIKACVATARIDPNAPPANFPLRIDAAENGIAVSETQYSKDFMRHIFKSIDWRGLCTTVQQLNHPELPSLPTTLPANYEDDEDLLRAVHHIIFGAEIIEGELVCNNCGRSYPISGGVPNMLLEEDEM